MSRAYKFYKPDGLYFITFATVAWVDVFTRREYKDIVVESLRFCQKEKGLLLYAWVIMSNHVHLIASAAEGHRLQDIIRDLKKFTSKQIIRAIEEHPGESRREWMLRIFRNAGTANSNNKDFQFWQQHNKPIELASNAMIGRYANYLHENPVKAGYVEHAEDYVYCSAPAIAGKPTLLELEEL
ncbi:MAG: transposase [Flavobacteriales bacterium]